MLTSKVPEVHETQNGAERRGKILPWDVVGRGGFNLTYLKYMLEFLLRVYGHFKSDG